MGLLINACVFLWGLIFSNFSGVIFWCKWIISYIYVTIYRYGSNKRFDLYDYSKKHDPEKSDYIIPTEEYDMDGPQSETNLLTKDDEIFFYGANSKSEVLVAKINRMWNNRAEACIYMKLSGKIYQLEKIVDVQQSCTDKMTFSCGGLQLQCTTPMRQWRLYYAGYLKETSGSSTSSESMVYVKFALLWRAASDIYDFEADISTKDLANGLSKASWDSFVPQFIDLRKALNFYGQAGVIHGTVTVEEEFEDKEIYLFGQRIRYLGSVSHLEDLDFKHTLGYLEKTGLYFHMATISAVDVVKNFSFGFVIQSDADLKGIEEALLSSTSNEDEEECLKIIFKTDLTSYVLNATSIKDLNVNRTDKESFVKWIEFDLNGEIGHGLQIKRTKSARIDNEYSEVRIIEAPAVVPLVVSFNEKVCQLSDITGGKGSSLGMLTQLSKKLRTFTVPDGIVVTTSAYASFLTRDILNEIKLLQEFLYKGNNKPEEVQQACKRLYDVIVQTDFPTTLQDCMIEKLSKNFDGNLQFHKFAVRSSATGEDTEQMSAAGQMDTFLGVKGVDEILLAVKKCWASQFCFNAVEYKRRYGQNLNSPMAVVIQEMVPCDVAGVLFTCDPLTGNPTIMSITSNYGLGESVVSGSEEPDMMMLKRNENDELSIKNITIGAKKYKIVPGDGTGTDVTDVAEHERNVCSLYDEMILCLGDVAIKIEKHYRSYRDIEWGFYNSNLYIFQSRPVTNATNETIYEIEHEFDSPLRVENDYFSVSNVGEVMPKAFSPLGMDVSLKNFALVMNSKEKFVMFQQRQKRYFRMGWLLFYSHFIFNVADVFPMRPNEEMSTLKKSTLISFFGRVPDEEEMYEVTKARYASSSPEPGPFSSMYNAIKAMLLTNRILKKTIEDCSGYKIRVDEYNTSKNLFKIMLQRSVEWTRVSMCHIICSQTSSLWNMIIFSTLGTAQGDFDDIVYRDFANLLKTNSAVVSADVPSATQSIAYHISQAIKPEEFKKMSTKEALNWLMTSQSTAGKKFRAFMEKHGHRCLQEFDVHSHPWRECPDLLVELLQSLAANVSKDISERKPDDWNDLISKLNVPLGFISKQLFKWILPMARQGVQNREASKSLMVKGTDEWRKGWRKLAQLMVQEGKLPEEDLLFFMTMEDIRNFLKTNSPKIIARAIQRQRRHPIMNDYRFPEIMKGIPTPVNIIAELEVITNADYFSMKGIPVSQGVVKGYIRKAIKLEEAVHIQPKEILLTYSTDIGWSPYFPILAGVVTELGGLISHGAVVSREYGIPCIAGLHGATQNFQTGDYVILDGNKGILQKLPAPEA